MKFEFDEIGLKDEIELINIEKQIEKNQLQNNQTLGFNMDTLYDLIDDNK